MEKAILIMFFISIPSLILFTIDVISLHSKYSGKQLVEAIFMPQNNTWIKLATGIIFGLIGIDHLLRI